MCRHRLYTIGTFLWFHGLCSPCNLITSITEISSTTVFLMIYSMHVYDLGPQTFRDDDLASGHMICPSNSILSPWLFVRCIQSVCKIWTPTQHFYSSIWLFKLTGPSFPNNGGQHIWAGFGGATEVSRCRKKRRRIQRAPQHYNLVQYVISFVRKHTNSHPA